MKTIKRLFASRDGNVAMMFGLMLIPMLTAAAVGLDFVRRADASTGAQEALDAAVLYVARQEQLTTDAERSAAAKAFFLANFPNSTLDISSLTVTKTGDEYVADLDASVYTTLLGIVGVPELDVSHQSTVVLANNSFEIALALDSTGSMTGQKLTKLKEAAKYLVDKLDPEFTDGTRLKFSIIPFATFVNVGPPKASEHWMDQNANSPDHGDNFSALVNRFDLFDHLGIGWAGCVEARRSPLDTNDDPGNGAAPEGYFLPMFYPDDVDNRSWYPNDYLADTTTSGSILTRIADIAKYGASATMPAPTWSSVSLKSNYQYYSDLFTPIGPNFGCGIRPILPLTTDRTTTKDEIDALVAQGSTNMIEGIMWAWRTLSPGKPFEEGAPYANSHVKKIIILLTDGNNHIGVTSDARGSHYSAYGYLSDGRLGLSPGATQSDVYTAMDTRMRTACDNIKAEGITIYAIRLDLASDTRSEDLLKDCVTSASLNYLDVPDPDDLEAAFDAISDQILQLYISK